MGLDVSGRSGWVLVLAVVLASACSDGEGGAAVAPGPDVGADVVEDVVEDVGEDVGGDGGGEEVSGDVVEEEEVDACGEACTPVCGDGICAEGEAEGCVYDCDPAPIYRYEPLAGGLSTFPDDYFTVEAETVTGLRVDVTPERLAYVRALPAGFQDVFVDLSALDGWGTQAGGFLGFSRPLEPGSVAEGGKVLEGEGAAFLGYLRAGAFVEVPTEVLLTDEGRTEVFRPLVPLPPATRALAGVTRSARGLDGEAARPNAALEGLLRGEAPAGLEGMEARYAEAGAALVGSGRIVGVEEIAALTVFTTQSIGEEEDRVVADIQARPHGIAARQGCEEGGAWRRCVFTFEAGHYRGADRVLAVGEEGAPVELYTLSASVFLPREGEGPWPVIIYGHGLGGDRDQGGRLADFAAPLGIATVAIDAPEHGQHPIITVGEGFLGIAGFFGLTPGGVDAAALRDNWRQAAFDKLALIELLKAGADVDDDGVDDLDGGRLMYLGVSLGGIMGAQLAALSPDLGAVVLVVPGGRVTDILQFGEMFAPLVQLLRPHGTTDGDVARFWPVLQTAIERGDASNWAVQILRDRRVAGEPPDVLAAIVLDDDIVPEASNLALARALGAPHVPPVRRPVDLLEIAPPPPLSANLEGGVTAGFVQFDLVLEGEAWEAATHNNIGDSTVGAEAWLRFLDGWLQTGQAEIVDPYQTLGLSRP